MAALILGILSWKSTTGKIAVALIALLPLLTYALFVAQQPDRKVTSLTPPMTQPFDDRIAAPIGQQHFTKPPSSPPTGIISKDVAFGPVIERVVNDWRKNPTDSGIDLDSGELFSMPNDPMVNRGRPFKPSEQLNGASARERGIDAAGYVGVVATITHGTRQPVKKALRRSGHVGNVHRGDAQHGMGPSHSGGDSVAMGHISPSAGNRRTHIAGEFPSTRVFRTQKAAAGILQIVGFTGSVHKPIGVKIRYKMVKKAAAMQFPATGNDPDRLKLESAEQQLQLAETRFRTGQTSMLEYLKAKVARDLAKAVLSGNLLEAGTRNTSTQRKSTKSLRRNTVKAWCRPRRSHTRSSIETSPAMELRGLASAESMKPLLECRHIPNRLRPPRRRPARPPISSPSRQSRTGPRSPTKATRVPSTAHFERRLHGIDPSGRSPRQLGAGRSRRRQWGYFGDGPCRFWLLAFNRDNAARQRVEAGCCPPRHIGVPPAGEHPRQQRPHRPPALKDRRKSELLDPSGNRLAWWCPVKPATNVLFATYGDRLRGEPMEIGNEEIIGSPVLADPFDYHRQVLTQAKATGRFGSSGSHAWSSG